MNFFRVFCRIPDSVPLPCPAARVMSAFSTDLCYRPLSGRYCRLSLRNCSISFTDRNRSFLEKRKKKYQFDKVFSESQFPKFPLVKTRIA
jgi:hypothetical protein